MRTQRAYNSGLAGTCPQTPLFEEVAHLRAARGSDAMPNISIGRDTAKWLCGFHPRSELHTELRCLLGKADDLQFESREI